MKTWTLEELKNFIEKEFTTYENCKNEYQSAKKILQDNLAQAIKYAAAYYPDHIDELQQIIEERKNY